MQQLPFLYTRVRGGASHQDKPARLRCNAKHRIQWQNKCLTLRQLKSATRQYSTGKLQIQFFTRRPESKVVLRENAKKKRKRKPPIEIGRMDNEVDFPLFSPAADRNFSQSFARYYATTTASDSMLHISS